jgi:TonB family protein
VSGEGVGTLPRELAGVEGKVPILASRASALLRAVATALHRRVINARAVARIDPLLHELKPLTCGTGYRCTSEHDCIETSAWIARSQIEIYELCDQSSTITAVTLRLPRGEGYADWYCHFAVHEEERLHFETSVHLHSRDDDLCLPARGNWTMSTATTPAHSRRTASTRKVPRYKLTVPLDVTVLRSGIPDNIPGRTLEIGEGGMGVVVASQLLLGESVRVEFLLPHMSRPVRATAVVRYQRELSFGLQFLRLPDEQQSIIRYWTRHEAEISFVPEHRRAAIADLEAQVVNAVYPPDFGRSTGSKPGFGIRGILTFVILIIVVAALMEWRRWEQGWTELEAQVPARETLSSKPQLKVPPDVMQRRITHQVAPDYPEAARRAGVQGTVLLDAVVSVEGAVTQLNVINGPEALSPAAIDAVRWWCYEPYIVNGERATVETTISLNFRLPN